MQETRASNQCVARTIHRVLAPSMIAFMLAVATDAAAIDTRRLWQPFESCQSLQDQLDAAKTAAERQISAINLATCLLNQQCAAPLTKELLQESGVRKKIAQSATQALALLDGDAAKPASSHPGAKERIDLLRAFAMTFRAIAQEDGSETSRKALTDACIELAIHTDDTDVHVATAARLWQAAAYRRAGRHDRTLQMMRPALGRGSGSLADLYGRLERCRALADAEQYIAAITLTAKLEDWIARWWITQPSIQRAAGTQLLHRTRAELYQKWAAALKKKGLDERAASAEQSAQALIEKLKQSKTPHIRLDTTIGPLVMLAPTAREPTTKPGVSE